MSISPDPFEVMIDVVVRDQRIGRDPQHVDEHGLGEVLGRYRMPIPGSAVPKLGDTLVLHDGQAVEIVGIQDVLTDGGFAITAIIADTRLSKPSA